MAESNITVLDSTGVARGVDTYTLPDGKFQQAAVIGDGTTNGRIAGISAGGALKTTGNTASVESGINITSVITSTQIVAANANRRGLILTNDSTSILYLRYGSTAASSSSYSVKLATNERFFMDVPVWTGAIQGIWSAANGFARGSDLSE